jgi:hypothetical protein
MAGSIVCSMKPKEQDTPMSRRSRREALGLSRDVFAELLGVDAVTLWRWERGRGIRPLGWQAWDRVLTSLEADRIKEGDDVRLVR